LNYLTITGTSNLLAHNKAWDGLKHDVQVGFAEYADWAKVLTENDGRPVLWVVLLEDLLSPDRLLEDDLSTVQDDLDVILNPLISLLNDRQSPALVAFSSWRPGSVVSQARFHTAWKRVSTLFGESLYDLAKKYPSLHLIDLDEVFAEHGLVKCFDSRNYYLSRCRLSFQGLEWVASATKKVLERLKNPAKKVLVLDCDNTLWGDVVGEVGLSGITLGSDGLGQAFSDFQLVAKRWSSQGVLLAIASKNNEEDVWEVFDKHPGMKIRKDDLVAWRVNWQEKATNLKEMASELDLGIESFVFWDDNPLEREKIRQSLPEVTTPELPQDVTLWPALLDSFDDLAKFSATGDDRKKVRQYKQRTAFVNGKKKVVDQMEFLKSITLQPATLNLSEGTMARAEQLCQKTNQFNLRSERHTVGNLSNIATDPCYESFLITLTDRFGDHGIVAFVITRQDGETAFLNTFLMSCRVLGRHLEAWILNELRVRLSKKDCKYILAEYLPNQRNNVAATFLYDHGLTIFTWEQLPVNHPLLALRDLTDMSGQLYHADLETLDIPHLEIF
jgi:FkbH-like protein